MNVSGAKTFGIVIRPHPSGRGTIPLPHPNIHGPVPEAVQDIVDEAHARARLAKLPDSPIIYLSKEPNPNPGPWPGPEPFNKYIHTHPNSIGPGAGTRANHLTLTLTIPNYPNSNHLTLI